MSGGSFNYLCAAAGDLSMLLGKRDDMILMAHALGGIAGGEQAQKDTLALVDHLDAMCAEIQAMSQPLYGPWKAVEWWQSGDYGHGQAVDAVAEYNAAVPHGEAEAV